jgi:beta-galactosidase/beta-glucuronidase
MGRLASPSLVRARRASIPIALMLALSVLAPGAAVSKTTSSAPDSQPALTQALPPVVGNDGTRSIDFDAGWKFILVNPAGVSDPSGVYGTSVNPQAQAPGFNDSSWRSVTLPHDWSIELLPQSSGVSNATGYFQGGLGWYRKTFTLPRSMAGKQLSIEFDGVYMNSYVYLNGTVLGNHPYGYTGFSFDITNLVHTDGVTPNVLAVVVQNLLPSSRWYSGSGITRNVHLVVTNPIHVARLGTFVTTPNLATTITSDYADVNVATQIANDSGSPATVNVVQKVRDASGKVVAQATTSGVAVTGASATATTHVTVNHPHLWSTTDPYLYTVETDIVQAGKTIDTFNTTTGIRWIVMDPSGGVFVNGVHIKLQGVDLHNDEGAMGSVDNYDALWREMSILKSMGVNAFRTSHNPPSAEWIDVCDRLGIVMMVEAFDSWSPGKSSQDYGRFFAQPAVAGAATLAAAPAASDTNIKVSNITNFVAGQTINIDTGANLETKVIASVGTLGTGGTGITLTTPLALKHASAAVVVTVVGITTLSGASTTLAAGNGNVAAPSVAGDTNIKVSSVTNFAVGQTITIGAGANLETKDISTVGTSGSTGTGLTLTSPLSFAHVLGGAVLTVTPAGTTNIKVASVSNFVAGQSIAIDWGANLETATILTVGTATLTGTGITLSSGLTMAHGGNMPVVALTQVGATNIKIAGVANFTAGATITIDTGANLETATIATVGSTGVTGATTLSAASLVGATNIKVASISGLAVGQPINIDTGVNLETAVIATVGTSGASGTGLTLASALTIAHAIAAPVTWVPTGITFTSPLTLAHQTGADVVTDAGPGLRWGDVDIQEMVNEARNAPAVIMWSIGNEIPGFASIANLPVAARLISDIKSLDPTRAIVAGSDQYRSLPTTGSGNERILLMLDGLGLNYNPALVVDQLHDRYPNQFFFESESSSETSTRGYYQDPNLLNTGEDQTPGQHQVSSYDNNLASWTMSDEYGLKKDRDRTYFAGQFIWSGFDYIGEPTPYNVFPVKASFFGAIDTAGFPKDGYYAFQSQWTTDPMVHIVPMNWTNYRPGDIVQVWADSNAPTVELFLNGVSLGAKSFDQKTSTDGISYLETTECTNDDKNYTAATFPGGKCPGSYESPNGSSGKIHLQWDVPFAPGQLVAVASNNGTVVARDEVDTAGPAYALRLTPDKSALTANGKSLSYITVDVVDKNGVLVPNANNMLNFNVTGAGIFAGADNGHEDSAEGYKLPSHSAFNGKALAIVESTTSPGTITFTATADGLQPATTTIFSLDASKKGPKTDIVGVLPVYLRSQLGAPITLPASVSVVHSGGSTESMAVNWDKLKKETATKSDVYTIKGKVTGHHGPPPLDAQAILSVYDLGGIESFSTVVPVGTPPGLPATVKVMWNDGVDEYVPVVWDPVDPSAYAAPGTFVVNGTVAGVTTKAIASVRVTGTALLNQNIALSTNPLLPSPGASYSGASSTIPSRMIDGITDTGGWGNKFSKAPTNTLNGPITNSHPADWVSLRWPNPQRINNSSVFFTLNANNQLPETTVVSYWNGMAWVPVSNPVIHLSATTNTASTIKFDPVSTTGLRLDMTSSSPMNVTTGNISIAEWQVFADQVTYNTTASLTDLQVNGQTVAGFDPGTHDYSMQIKLGPKDVLSVTATAADNGRLLIVTPLSVPGTATVTVTSEDGATHSTYTVHLLK